MILKVHLQFQQKNPFWKKLNYANFFNNKKYNQKIKINLKEMSSLDFVYDY